MKRRLVCGFFLSVIAIAFVSPMPLSALTVRSADIVPADGTSGQVLTTGNGVKTGHIQNLAITSAKIAAGTIATSNIGSNQITNALLAPNAVTTVKIQDGAVGNADLADGAVTDAKITGPISASKISSTGLNADTVDGVHASGFAAASHTHAQSDVTGLATALGGKADVAHDHDTAYQKKYANLIVVAKGGGDFTDPIAAINSIADASMTNPYLIKIMPGIYDLGNGTLTMKGYVDIEGAGEGVTTITSAVTDGNGTVNGASNAELRLLSVTNTGTSTGVSAPVIYCDSSSSPKLTHLTLNAFSSGGNVTGVFNRYNTNVSMSNITVNLTGSVVIGLNNTTAGSTLTGVVINVSSDNTAYGIIAWGSNTTMSNVTITASAPPLCQHA